MTPDPHVLAFLNNLGWPELLIIGMVALLVFGRRLPEVGRSLGKGIVEFKKGLADTGDQIKEIPKQSDSGASRNDATDGKKLESAHSNSHD